MGYHTAYRAEFSIFAFKLLTNGENKWNKVILAEKRVSQTELTDRTGKGFSTVNTYCCNRQ